MAVLTHKQWSPQDLAEQCADAYSTDNYRGGWIGCVKMLRRRGFTDLQIETILRSKWTRWAADSSGKRYGQNTGRDLERFMFEKSKSEVMATLRAQLGL